MLRKPRLTLAVAESLTCGRLQARVGAISGASDFFRGGITAYSLDQKVRHLGVDRSAASAVNSVSSEVAEQMARGACALFDADIAVATTGYAEPSSEWNVATPYAWWAVARRHAARQFEVRSGRAAFENAGRTETQEGAADAAFAALLQWIRDLRSG